VTSSLSAVSGRDTSWPEGARSGPYRGSKTSEVQLPDSPTEVKGVRAVRAKRQVRISQRGRVTYIRNGTTFHRCRCEGDVSDYVFVISSRPHMILLKTLEVCKIFRYTLLSLRYSLFTCYLNFIVVFTIASNWTPSSWNLNLSVTSHFFKINLILTSLIRIRYKIRRSLPLRFWEQIV